MSSRFEEIPQRVFLDSTILQTLLRYGGFLYENEPVDAADKIWQNPHGMANLEALRDIMHVNERAQFQFALSPNAGTPAIPASCLRRIPWPSSQVLSCLVCSRSQWSFHGFFSLVGAPQRLPTAALHKSTRWFCLS